MSEIPTLAEVIDAADRLWPLRTQQSWDASGLIAGRPEAPVRRILMAVDAVTPTVQEAVETEADLLLTHHPLLMRGVSCGYASLSDFITRALSGCTRILPSALTRNT